MPRELRSFVPGRYYFITNRTLEERFWLRPDSQTNDACTKALAVATEKYRDVKLIAFVVMSNHFHLVVQAGTENTVSDFVGLFQARLARQVNQRLERTGPVWQRRFSAIPIVDSSALKDRIEYTVLNPVRAGLVRQIDQWPGLVSHRSDGSRNRFRADGRVLNARFRKVSHGFHEENRKAIGVRKILKCPLSQRPAKTKRSRAPLCHATDAISRQRYLNERRHFYQAYHIAADLYRTGKVDVVFPLGCQPPSRYPRLVCAA